MSNERQKKIHKTLAIFKSHKQCVELIYANKPKNLDKLENILGEKMLPKLTYDKKENLTRPMAIIHVI